MDIKVNDSTVVVFDLDDTLYNELDYLKSAYKSIAMYLEPDNWKRLYLNMFSLYRSKENAFEFLLNTYNIKLEVLLDLYRNHRPNIQLFEGVIEIFEDIKSKNGKIAVITDGRSKAQRAKLESLGVLDYLDGLIISEEFGSEKPSLANFEAIENSLPGSTYYYIADNLKKDFIAPNTLGWKSVGLIDNGKNIHFEAYQIIDQSKLPQQFILEIKELNIV